MIFTLSFREVRACRMCLFQIWNMLLVSDKSNPKILMLVHFLRRNRWHYMLLPFPVLFYYENILIEKVLHVLLCTKTHFHEIWFSVPEEWPLELDYLACLMFHGKNVSMLLNFRNMMPFTRQVHTQLISFLPFFFVKFVTNRHHSYIWN